MAVEGQHVPLETVTKSANRILISCKLTEICQFICFWHLPNLKSDGQNQSSCSCTLNPFISRSQTTKHCESVLRNARFMANWNFVTSAFDRGPRFLCQGQDHGSWTSV